MGVRLTQAGIVLAVVVASGLAVGLVLAVVLASGQIAVGPTSNVSVSSWQRDPHNPIIVPGFAIQPGGPAGSHVADASVLYDENDQRWKMWFATGWTRGAAERSGIKYAESRDSVHWSVEPGLALEPAAAHATWDHTHIETPTVVKSPSGPPDRRYLLWYAGGNAARRTLGHGFPYYQIGLAVSSDGRRFVRLPAAESPYASAGLVLVVQHALPAWPQARDGMLTEPDVLLTGGTFHMWFTTLALSERGQTVTAGISHATSRDGVSWTAARKNPLPSLMREFPITPSAQPSVVWNARTATFEMWYANDRNDELDQIARETREFATPGYWFAWSKNGEDWMTYHGRGRDFLWDRRAAPELYGLLTGIDVVLRRGKYRMYYTALGGHAPRGWPAQRPPQRVIWALNLATR